MGMAASQARYLALVARKSNCEYEGQQINQARTALSNQSANLFNQMLGLQVPVPPSTQDFTKTQYSYTDGINASTISSWQQLSETDPDYNYVVTHYYYTDRYTGSMKKLSDPQVQFSGGTNLATESEIQAALLDIDAKYEAYMNAKELRMQEEAKKSDLSLYYSEMSSITNGSYNSTTLVYTINQGGTTTNFTSYNNLTDPAHKLAIDNMLQKMIDNGALTGNVNDYHDEVFVNFIGYTPPNFDLAFKDDLDDVYGVSSTGSSTKLPYYNNNNVDTIVASIDTLIASAKLAEVAALTAYETALDNYEDLNVPTYIGNCELTPLTNLSADQLAEINQVIADLEEQGIDSEIKKCFDANSNYTGGIYSFKMNGITYYTTLQDLNDSYASGTGNNHIDGQIKLNYYNATYISTKVEETEKALLETDGYGRFSSIRFENDTVTYALNMETVTDDVAYEDAMNQYYYENAKYDKMVQDINAKTSIIHQQDRQLELRLKQLDTEQSALSTEMDAVKKVVDDNVEKSFKTFNG